MTNSHLKKILLFVFQWNRDLELPKYEIISTMFIIATPIIIGHMVGNLRLGITLSMGGLFIIPPCGKSPLKSYFSSYVAMVIIAFISIATASYIGGMSQLLRSSLIVIILSAVALLGNINKNAIPNSIRFSLLFIIGASYHTTDINVALLIGLQFSLSMIWAIFISVCSYYIFGMNKNINKAEYNKSENLFLKDLLLFIKSLSKFKTWQFPLRIMIYLSIAQIIQVIYSTSNTYWISMTIILVIQRNLTGKYHLAIQRKMGTMLGVIIGLLLSNMSISFIGFLAIILILGGFINYLKKQNYLLYSTAMAIFVFILHTPSGHINHVMINERFVYTIYGCVIVLLLDFISNIIKDHLADNIVSI